MTETKNGLEIRSFDFRRGLLPPKKHFGAFKTSDETVEGFHDVVKPITRFD